uniref:Uncharacterized protein n=1 Tax=Arion vulgaris TaxID=1028688 RepID=A0A0B7AHM6_9EUPU
MKKLKSCDKHTKEYVMVGVCNAKTRVRIHCDNRGKKITEKHNIMAWMCVNKRIDHQRWKHIVVEIHDRQRQQACHLIV